MKLQRFECRVADQVLPKPPADVVTLPQPEPEGVRGDVAVVGEQFGPVLGPLLVLVEDAALSGDRGGEDDHVRERHQRLDERLGTFAGGVSARPRDRERGRNDARRGADRSRSATAKSRGAIRRRERSTDGPSYPRTFSTPCSLTTASQWPRPQPTSTTLAGATASRMSGTAASADSVEPASHAVVVDDFQFRRHAVHSRPMAVTELRRDRGLGSEGLRVPLSVCCMTSGRRPDLLGGVLAPFRKVADEIVVAVESERLEAVRPAVAGVADRLLAFPAAAPADRPIAWLFRECAGRWIFNVDDDEVPSPALVDRLHELIRREDVTHMNGSPGAGSIRRSRRLSEPRRGGRSSGCGSARGRPVPPVLGRVPSTGRSATAQAPTSRSRSGTWTQC